MPGPTNKKEGNDFNLAMAKGMDMSSPRVCVRALTASHSRITALNANGSGLQSDMTIREELKKEDRSCAKLNKKKHKRKRKRTTSHCSETTSGYSTKLLHGAKVRERVPIEVDLGCRRREGDKSGKLLRNQDSLAEGDSQACRSNFEVATEITFNRPSCGNRPATNLSTIPLGGQDKAEIPLMEGASAKLKFPSKKRKRLELDREEEAAEIPNVEGASAKLKIPTMKCQRLEHNTLKEEVAEIPMKERASAKLKISTKKRKRLEREGLKEEADKAEQSSAATKARLSEGERVWQYVCKRAVLVDPSGYTSNHLLGIGSMTSRLNTQAEKTVFGQKTKVTEVVVNGKKLAVTITKEGAVAQEWIQRQEGTVFGMDAEWRPSYTKGVQHKVALLQVCGETECLLLQMLFLDTMPWALVDFLKNPNIRFAGVGIPAMPKKLLQDHRLECTGAVELTTLASKHLNQAGLKYLGLKALAKLVIDFEMEKPKKVTMSNWAKPLLDHIQVEYACLDAWVSYAIYKKLLDMTTCC